MVRADHGRPLWDLSSAGCSPAWRSRGLASPDTTCPRSPTRSASRAGRAAGKLPNLTAPTRSRGTRHRDFLAALALLRSGPKQPGIRDRPDRDPTRLAGRRRTGDRYVALAGWRAIRPIHRADHHRADHHGPAAGAMPAHPCAHGGRSAWVWAMAFMLIAAVPLLPTEFLARSSWWSPGCTRRQ